MKLKHALFAALIWAPFGTAAHANIISKVEENREMLQRCVSEGRDVCVVFAATALMTDIAALNYLFTEDPDALNEVVAAFEKSSFAVSSEGRPEFRKFLAENAIWTLDYFNERFQSRVNPDYAYEDVRHFYAAYQLLRASACDELENAPCAKSALWAVNNARSRDLWPTIAERFAMSDEFSVKMVEELFAAYEGEIE